MKYSTCVITVSDRCYRGEAEDTAGPAVSKLLAENGFDVFETRILPDENALISSCLIECANARASLIVTVGGTGLSKRDVTPEATAAVCEKFVPGIPEAMRALSLELTDRAMLSRSICGVRGNSIILNLPGSLKAATENLSFVIKTLSHAILMLNGGAHN
ncbi:MAG: MogA/MoaB family molybdenum cofactor biosynthesis protein [Clostridia bacterium]